MTFRRQINSSPLTRLLCGYKIKSYFLKSFFFSFPHRWICHWKRLATKAQDGLHQHATARTRKGISFQQIFVSTATNRNRRESRSNRATGKISCGFRNRCCRGEKSKLSPCRQQRNHDFTISQWHAFFASFLKLSFGINFNNKFVFFSSSMRLANRSKVCEKQMI